MSWWNGLADDPTSHLPVKVSTRTLAAAVEDALIDAFTRKQLEVVLEEELHLQWGFEHEPAEADTKRDLIRGYTSGQTVPRLVALARTLMNDYPITSTQLTDLLKAYDSAGGVAGPTKNLIFAANGPKPELVLRDAVNNDIEIVSNSEFCLVYDKPLPADGLTMTHLSEWWRTVRGLGEGTSVRDAARDLHHRLRASLDGNSAELRIFDTYQHRYRDSLDIPALIPQVYLHYDPQLQSVRRALPQGAPLARQRMDFLLLFSDRRRVVIEVDGQQHYSENGRPSPRLYSSMVAEDRRLKLAGYEVFRFGGAELFNDDSEQLVATFFDQLTDRMAH